MTWESFVLRDQEGRPSRHVHVLNPDAVVHEGDGALDVYLPGEEGIRAHAFLTLPHVKDVVERAVIAHRLLALVRTWSAMAVVGWATHYSDHFGLAAFVTVAALFYLVEET